MNFNLITILTILALMVGGTPLSKTAKTHPSKDNILKDHEGNEYEYIIRNGYMIMIEGLRTETFKDGTKIPRAKSAEDWQAAQTNQAAAYCYYENSKSKAKKYGYIYNSHVLYQHGGVSPDGWHVPSIDEWKTIIGEKFTRKYNSNKQYPTAYRLKGTKPVSYEKIMADRDNPNFIYQLRLAGGGRNTYKGKFTTKDHEGIELHTREGGRLDLWQFNPDDLSLESSSNLGRGMYIRCVKKIDGDVEILARNMHIDDRVFLMNYSRSLQLEGTKDQAHFGLELPSSNTNGVQCQEGNCDTGEGTAFYVQTGGVYKGSFKEGLPNGSGIVINAAGDTLYANFKNGLLDGKQYTRGVKGQPITIDMTSNRPYSAENLYYAMYQAYYSGRVSPFMNWIETPEMENTLRNEKFDLKVYLDKDNALEGFRGSKVENGYIYFAEYTPEMKIANKDFKAYTKDGRVEYRFMVIEDEVALEAVTITFGDTIYNGAVNKEWQPHGRGTLSYKRKTLVEGEWSNGKAIGGWDKDGKLFGTYRKTTPEEKEEAMKEFTAIINKTYPRGYSYFGRPDGEFRVNSKGLKKMALFNLNNKPVEVSFKITYDINKDFGLAPFIKDQGWRTVVLPGSSSLKLKDMGTRKYTLDFTAYGGATIKFRNTSAKDVAVFIE